MPTAPFETDTVERLLRSAAAARTPLSYAEALERLGHRFSRPLMRSLCKALDQVDERAAAAGEPALAVLVVRAADGLPGQGWWVGRSATCNYRGGWEGAPARALVGRLQASAFAYWEQRLPVR